MPTFKDSKAREYECQVTVATAIALKRDHGVNLMAHFDGSLYERLASDPELLIDVLAETVRVSLDTLGLDEATFAASLDGNTLESAVVAMREAITDFSPPRQRAAMKRLMEKSDQVQTLAVDRVNLAIDQLSPEAILKAMEMSGLETLSNSAGSSSPSPTAESQQV